MRGSTGSPTDKTCIAELGLTPLPMAWIANMLSALSLRLIPVIGKLQTVAIILKAHTVLCPIYKGPFLNGFFTESSISFYRIL